MAFGQLLVFSWPQKTFYCFQVVQLSSGKLFPSQGFNYSGSESKGSFGGLCKSQNLEFAPRTLLDEGSILVCVVNFSSGFLIFNHWVKFF